VSNLVGRKKQQVPVDRLRKRNRQAEYNRLTASPRWTRTGWNVRWQEAIRLIRRYNLTRSLSWMSALQV